MDEDGERHAELAAVEGALRLANDNRGGAGRHAHLAEVWPEVAGIAWRTRSTRR